MTAPPASYRPIESYAAIGNLRTIALVNLDGAIDWLCLPALDAASVFGALMDASRGGRFRVCAARGSSAASSQTYVDHTNVLETRFRTDRGTLVVTDFMPLAGSLEGTGAGSRAPPEVCRLVRAEGGPVDVEIEWSPRFDYARGRTRVTRHGAGFLAWAGAEALVLAGLDERDACDVGGDALGPVIRARLHLRAGERRALTTRWGAEPRRITLDEAQRSLAETVEAWRAWVHKAEATGSRSWAGPQRELVLRSELALKLLTMADTGAIAAAATSSLPEEIGGVRNWDYRMSWIRDAALGAQAFLALGHRADATSFMSWAEHAAQAGGDGDGKIKILYGLHGQAALEEQELPNLEGYRRSSPVRIGNGAADQLQLDVYGELISVAYEIARVGEPLGEEIRAFLPSVAEQACAHWTDRDHGLWELRNGPQDFVYSKVMVWAALDRALRLADLGVIDGDVPAWRATCGAIRKEVLDRGYDPALGAFKQSFERSACDASNLLIPLLEFLSFDDPRVMATIDATLARLTENDLVYRYTADDGIAGGEGAFTLCTFWLVDALALSGRLDEAHRIYERLAARANHAGLYAEQIDPTSGAFLGNFPQAFSHIGLINSALYLAYAEGRETPVPAPIGSREHRETFASRS
jgi:GH15 family glucan-1,4-alpha-glucosidase